MTSRSGIFLCFVCVFYRLQRFCSYTSKESTVYEYAFHKFGGAVELPVEHFEHQRYCGSAQFVEILFEAKDLSDFLNKTEYISSISDYDRDMLTKYQEIVKQVEAQEAALQKEQEEMEVMQDELIAKQGSLQELLTSKENEIDGLKEEINANADRVKKLEAAAKAAADAARKKAEAEAAAKEAAAQAEAARKNAAVSRSEERRVGKECL